MIIFPAIDLRRGRCVRLRQGRAEDETVYDEDPASVACRWVDQGAEWLHVVNLDGALADDPLFASGCPWPLNLQRLAEIRAAVPGTPIQFGGGIRSMADLELALEAGATRVILGTIAIESPELVTEAVRQLGSERIVVGIDARQGRVATHGWKQSSAWTAKDLAQAMRARGVVRIVYTDIARDGMLTGVNIVDTVALARATGLKVIASGGVASLHDIAQLKAQASAGIEGVIVGQALYTGAVSLPEAIQLAREE